jgi:hypothetical protein
VSVDVVESDTQTQLAVSLRLGDGLVVVDADRVPQSETEQTVQRLSGTSGLDVQKNAIPAARSLARFTVGFMLDA